MNKIVLKTIIHNELTVYNVPHILYERGIGPDGEKDYIDGNVLYQLFSILKDMKENNIKEFDYNKFERERFIMTTKTISKKCMTCDYQLDLPVTDEQYEKLTNGNAHIQDVLSHVNPDDRELLVSGICGKCFDKIFN